MSSDDERSREEAYAEGLDLMYKHAR